MNYSIFIDIFFAILLSGMIGLERERINRPAGFRTHILVCVGATISMKLGLLLSLSSTSIDPSRLGAAVISGIGFLGAGTIIKEGSSVSGLTTAAGLWAVACIGLLIGSGCYFYAFVTTFSVFITLQLFAKLEMKLSSSSKNLRLSIVSTSKAGQIGKIGTVLGENEIVIKKIYVHQLKDNNSQIQLILESNKDFKKDFIADIISSIEGIISLKYI